MNIYFKIKSNKIFLELVRILINVNIFKKINSFVFFIPLSIKIFGKCNISLYIIAINKGEIFINSKLKIVLSFYKVCKIKYHKI